MSVNIEHVLPCINKEITFITFGHFFTVIDECQQGTLQPPKIAKGHHGQWTNYFTSLCPGKFSLDLPILLIPV